MRVAAIVAVALLVATCVSTRERHAEAINSARAALREAPAAPREALRFANAIISNLRERSPDDQEPLRDDEIEHAADSLEKAAERVPAEAPLLLERLGALWMATRDVEKSEDAYRASLKAKPNKPALWALIEIAGSRGKVEQVRALCTEGASALEAHELRDHVATCARAAKLTSTAAALEWLKDEDRDRLDKEAARQASRDRDEREEQAARKKRFDVCEAGCRETSASCLARCTTNQPQCPTACEAKLVACTDGCKADS